MSRVEIPELIEQKFYRQSLPDSAGTLKRCECDIGNLIENALIPLHPDDLAVLIDLHNQIAGAIERIELAP